MNSTMQLVLWGTRGSVPVAGKNFAKYGGNTTCFEVISQCLPPNNFLAIDAGSGFVPMSADVMRRSGKAIFSGEVSMYVGFTHFHHDHTQGLPLSPLTFIKPVKMNVMGPVDHKIGPRDMLETVMQPPFFPVHFKEIASHFTCKSLEFPNANIAVFHPTGGLKILSVEEFERMEKGGGHVPVGKDGKYPIAECLVIKMYRSNHPEQTISYRLEERPTGKVAVIMTDHENQDGIPADLRKHLRGANLLILDAQYTEAAYHEKKCGFGHGTGMYCARVAKECGVEKLGLTHHDPFSSDEIVEEILTEARVRLESLPGENGLKPENVFACADYDVITV